MVYAWDSRSPWRGSYGPAYTLSTMLGSKNRVRYTPVSSSTTREYSASSPSRNDQWSGNALRTAPRLSSDNGRRASAAVNTRSAVSRARVGRWE